MIDAACKGTFFNKNEDEAWALFETLSENSQHYASSSRRTLTASSSVSKRDGLYEVGHVVDVQDPVARGQPNTPTPLVQEACAICTCPTYFVSDCPLASQYPEFVQEQVNALQGYPKPGNDPFSNTYNPGWKYHANFSWKPQTSNPSPFFQNQRPNVPNPFDQSSYRSEERRVGKECRL